MKRLTHNDFLNKLKLSNDNFDNIIILEKYKTAKTKLLCQCKIDGYTWRTSPDSLLRNRGCPKCAGNYRKTHMDFVNEMNVVNESIIILSEYLNDRTKVKCKCSVDNYEWDATPNSLLQGKGCPKCSRHIHKTTDIFTEELFEINPEIEILSEYHHCEQKIKCKCKKDNYVWYATPSNLLRGTGCPVCKTSKGEKRIIKFLDDYGIHYESQKKFNGLIGVGGKNLSYDFYLPFYNILIEYQGGFHDGNISGSYCQTFDFEKQKEHDSRKRLYAKDNNIGLLEIWYQDFNNIEQILMRTLNLDNKN